MVVYLQHEQRQPPRRRGPLPRNAFNKTNPENLEQNQYHRDPDRRRSHDEGFWRESASGLCRPVRRLHRFPHSYWNHRESHACASLIALGHSITTKAAVATTFPIKPSRTSEARCTRKSNGNSSSTGKRYSG